MSLFVMRPARTTQNTPPLTSATHNVTVIRSSALPPAAVPGNQAIQQQQLLMAVSNPSIAVPCFQSSTLPLINNGNDNNNKTTTRPQSNEKKGKFCSQIVNNCKLHPLCSLGYQKLRNFIRLECVVSSCVFSAWIM